MLAEAPILFAKVSGFVLESGDGGLGSWFGALLWRGNGRESAA